MDEGFAALPFPVVTLAAGSRVTLEAVPQRVMCGPYRVVLKDPEWFRVLRFQIGQDTLTLAHGGFPAIALNAVPEGVRGPALNLGNTVQLELQNLMPHTVQAEFAMWGRVPAMWGRVPDLRADDFSFPSLMEDDHPIDTGAKRLRRAAERAGLFVRGNRFAPSPRCLSLHEGAPELGIAPGLCCQLSSGHEGKHEGTDAYGIPLNWPRTILPRPVQRHETIDAEYRPAPAPPPPPRCSSRRPDTGERCQLEAAHEFMHCGRHDDDRDPLIWWPNAATPARDELVKQQRDRDRYLDDPDGWSAWESPTDES